ncbi:hypothetical protein MTR67_043558 [Solanum verrucosum]|uniref:DUF4216 domain-containing protein n=1 Tax=Solanum verrucosum TaxID=315347 RepID=A0AAF0URL2_SOLVR|nr:hypothetical protein MTR67_043558 [Solanum verrucosum]
MEDDEDIQDEFSHMFSKTGHPIESEKERKRKTFEMDINQWSEAHRYALFNTGDEQVEAFINGVTLPATTDSFASARDKNPIDGMVTYYAVIRDIIEIDYYGYFSVVLFRCDWFHNEVDEYQLTQVYFNRLCSANDPFVLASQVNQFFYVEDPIEKEVHYAIKKVHVDLYDLEEEDCPNIDQTFWREPNDDIGSSDRLLDVDVRWSREDLPVDIVDVPSSAEC